MAKDEYLYVVEAEDAQGQTRQYWIKKKGSSFVIHGPNFSSHLCHPSRTDREGVLREVALVFKVTVKGTKQLWELNQPAAASKPDNPKT